VITGGLLILSPNFTVLGKDLEDTVTVNTANGQQSQVTLTSSDPSRVLLSSSAVAPGQRSLTMTTPPGQVQFYAQALSDTGTVTLTLSSPGYQDAQTQIRLGGSSVVLQSMTVGVLTPLSSPVSFQGRLAPVNGNSFNQALLRPGAATVVAQVNLTDPRIGTVIPSQLTFTPGSGVENFSFQPTAAGSALLTLSVPTGFVDPGPARQQLLNVIPVRINLTGSLSVGKDLLQSTSINLPSPLGQAVTFTVTSSNAGLVLLSNTASGGGTASISVPMAQGSSASAPFYIHGLAASGSVSLQVSAPQAGSSAFTASLQPAGFAFNPLNTTTVSVNQRTFIQILSYGLNPQTLAPESNQALRPGAAPVSLTIVSSDPSILGTSAPVAFRPGDSLGNLLILPSAPGVATLTIQAPAGFTMPSSGASATISVH
jgi:hypothetical protein